MYSPELFCEVRIDARDELLVGAPGSVNPIRQYFILGQFNYVSSWYNPVILGTSFRGNMNRQGTITDLGVADYEANGEIKGSLAIKVRLDDDKIKIDLRIVNDGGGVLAEWVGVDVIDDSQITWCFSDVGDIKLIMNPIIEPDD